MLRNHLALAAVSLALVAVAHDASAQANVGTINATATVLTPLAVTAGGALAFGNVYPGVAKTIAVADAGAGSFSVAGAAGANVNLAFTLPTNLTTTGGATLPVSAWTGYKNKANSATSGGTAFTPSTTGTESAQLDGTTSALSVFLGATVTPAVGQSAGVYTNTVTMTVTYTGT